jgi:integrase
MRYKSPFTLFKRQIPCGIWVWYYAAYDENGHRRQFSTGCTRKSEARRLCMELFKANRLFQNKSPLFKDYTADWFDYDKCLYIKSRLLRGFTYSKSFADHQRSTLINIMWPYFGTYPLDKINVTLIEKWLAKLKADGYKNVSINHHLAALKVIINEAFRRGDISVNPALAVRPLAEDSKVKGVFSKEEAEKLASPDGILTVWEGNEMHYTLNLLAKQSGMRLGEIQALLKTSIYPDHIEVCHSWDRIYGLKGTKTNKPRQIPISTELYNRLEAIAADQKDGDFIFSMNGGTSPIDHSIIYKWFKRALANIGIPEKTRAERNLSFHSWRHFVNTELRTSGIPDPIVQSITGHADIKMSEHYTHVQLEDMSEARKVLAGTTDSTGGKK